MSKQIRTLVFLLIAVGLIAGFAMLVGTTRNSDDDSNSSSDDTSVVADNDSESSADGNTGTKDAIQNIRDNVVEDDQEEEENKEEAENSSEESNDSQTAGDVPDVITLDIVAEHKNINDCWTAINGKVYDVTDYIDSHPGGISILNACGGDGTTLFETQGGQGPGHSGNAAALLEKYEIGVLS